MSLQAPEDRSTTTAQSFFPSPEQIEGEIAGVMALELSPVLDRWVARYARVGHRNPFLWKWCRRGVEITTLSCVEEGLRDLVCDTRVLGVVLDVLLDDVADNQGDAAFLEHLLQGIDGSSPGDATHLSPQQRSYAQFTGDVWNEIQRRVRSFPRYDEFAPLLDFDYRQLFNMMRYSRLTNEYREMLNLAEHDLYTPHNMHMMVSCTIDLMASPGFDRRDLGLLREAVWRAQCMGRIGNLVTTWQREIGESDFSSGVFSRALWCGDLTVDDLRSDNRAHLEAVIRDNNHEAYFLQRWQEHRREILSIDGRCRSVDLAGLVAGLQRLICLHLGSRGKK